ncbi:MAG: hypothetical protein IJ434_04260 [Alistipes sp.]|nr:hypothetical protein [Alistipes sp.]
MKKILLFAIFAIAVLCGCEKEIEEDNSLPQDPQITLTTNKEVGETIVLRFNRDNIPPEVIGATKIDEKNSDAYGGIFEAFVVDVTYALTSQTVVLKGDIVCLRCRDNELTSLDISGCPGLKFLQCDNNQLTTFIVSDNPELGFLSCANNQLTQLDVSKNAELGVLFCNSNKLTSLDISKNEKLGALNCANNKLTSLDVSKNTKLYDFGCSLNKIKSAEMSKIIKALPDWTGKTIWHVGEYSLNYAKINVVSNNNNEENEISEADIKIAEAKNWKF